MEVIVINRSIITPPSTPRHHDNQRRVLRDLRTAAELSPRRRRVPDSNTLAAEPQRLPSAKPSHWCPTTERGKISGSEKTSAASATGGRFMLAPPLSTQQNLPSQPGSRVLQLQSDAISGLDKRAFYASGHTKYPRTTPWYLHCLHVAPKIPDNISSGINTEADASTVGRLELKPQRWQRQHGLSWLKPDL
ncbi:hypothetical protein DFH09DRAFT_1068651 [Mycena vulgaris]|nr:hypothetical protein DFH09DRAFT_1068651 [Mycena vulgaris]